MAKYRKCPSCGAINPPSLLACKECGSDSLEFEKILDDTVIEGPKDTFQTSNSSHEQMIRICDCGAHNSIQARKCIECGEDISDIIPVPNNEQIDQYTQEIVHYVLSSIDGEYAYELVDNITIIGRENAMQEYLTSRQYVSRRQAEILIEEGKVFIKNLSKTNYTFVNNDKLMDDNYIELHDGDELGLGGKSVNGKRQEQAAYMQVRIGTCI